MKILNEDYNIADPESRKKIAARAVDLIRVSKLAREASVRAQNENKLDLAQKLNKRADELELLAKNIHIDKLDDEENNKEKEVKNSSANKDIQKETPESTSELEKTEKDQNGKDSEEDSKASENDSKEDQTNSENDSKENSKKEPNNSENDSKENSKESKEEEPKDSEDDDAPIINPFMDGNENEVIPTKHSDKQPRDATIDELYDMLNTLSGEARHGAIAALDAILANKATVKQESLTYAKLLESKTAQEMSDDEFADLVNSTLDLIDQIEKPEYINDKEERITKIKSVNNNTKANRELAAEYGIELAKDFQKAKAREQENQKYSHYRTVDQFKINFYNSIKDQVEQVRKEYQSYKEINPEYEDEGVIMKADVVDYIPDEAKPIINLYFDVSGSWAYNTYAIELGKQIVATIKEFEDNNEIILNLLYFGNKVSSDMHARGVWNSGTFAWNKILQNIKVTNAKNIVLMTDLDMEGQAKSGPVCKVDGDVWIIWNTRYDAAGGKEIPKHLIGRGSNLQYAFN